MTARNEDRTQRGDLERRYEVLARRHAIELKLAAVAAEGGGIAALVRLAADVSPNPMWLLDGRQRVVARSTAVRGSDFTRPDVERLLEEHGPLDLASFEPFLVPARPARGFTRRHLVVPVTRGSCLFAWLVVAEVSGRLADDEAWLAHRTAFHLASEYAVQQRVASASWNARSSLARRLVSGSDRDEDVAAAADYLGVQLDADRIVVYVADQDVDEPRDEHEVAEALANLLDAEVLGARGRDGALLLVEAGEAIARSTSVLAVKRAMRKLVADRGEADAIVGVSAVTRPDGLRRAYRETREVVLCVQRFACAGDRVVAVDDLGPARLLAANGDVATVRRYVEDVLGALLGTVPGSADLLRTLQCFFDAGRSVRDSAGRLGIHENTVRLRMAKIHDLTGLDVAGNSNDQLSAQTALLVLRLGGHPAIPTFGDAEQLTAGSEPAAYPTSESAQAVAQ